MLKATAQQQSPSCRGKLILHLLDASFPPSPQHTAYKQYYKMWPRNASHGAEQVQEEVDVGSHDTEMSEARIREMIA
jgi:hypothetical protein